MMISIIFPDRELGDQIWTLSSGHDRFSHVDFSGAGASPGTAITRGQDDQQQVAASV